jgi:hypothetical protein
MIKMSPQAKGTSLTQAEREVRALKRKLRDATREAQAKQSQWIKRARLAERRARKRSLEVKDFERKVRLAEAHARETDLRLAQASVQTSQKSPEQEALSTAALVESLLPEAPLPSSDKILQARRNAAARWHLLQEFGAFSSDQIADLRSRAKNRHALANRWRNEGRIFAVEYRGQLLHPAFQFDHETFDPLPVISDALKALPRQEMSPWEIGLWWTADNGWLDGARPVDVVDGQPEAIIQAAAKLAEPSPF